MELVQPLALLTLMERVSEGLEGQGVKVKEKVLKDQMFYGDVTTDLVATATQGPTGGEPF